MATVRIIEGCCALYFLFTASGLSWRQGQEECERLGGYLAEIKSSEQEAALDGLLSYSAEYWIGLSDLSVEGRVDKLDLH